MARELLRHFPVTPVPAPRMTQRDRWLHRPVVVRYRAFRDELRLRAGSWQLPDSGTHIIFHLPMPDSWSAKKRLGMLGKPHLQRPDADNCLKAFLDGLFLDDAHIWDVRISKLWGNEGSIEVWSIG
jgi:Holliday junction resolvase RusA-like endonuclease